MYLIIFKCNIFQDKGVWFSKEYQKAKSWLRKEELGMEEGNLLLSKWKKLLNTE